MWVQAHLLYHAQNKGSEQRDLWWLYPDRVVESLGSSVTEVKLVSKLSLLGLLRSHQFFFDHCFSYLETKTQRISCEREVVGNQE